MVGLICDYDGGKNCGSRGVCSDSDGLVEVGNASVTVKSGCCLYYSSGNKSCNQFGKICKS